MRRGNQVPSPYQASRVTKVAIKNQIVTAR